MKSSGFKAAWLRYCEEQFPDDRVAAEELANDEGCRDLFAAGALWKREECAKAAESYRYQPGAFIGFDIARQIRGREKP